MPLNSPKLEFYIWFRFRPHHRSHSATVSEILSKSDHPRQEKMQSCRFSRWRISAILDFRCPVMGSLKSPCATSYRSSIETIALNCLVFETIAFFCILSTDRQNKQTNRQTDEQMDSTDALRRCRERRLNNVNGCVPEVCQDEIRIFPMDRFPGHIPPAVLLDNFPLFTSCRTFTFPPPPSPIYNIKRSIVNVYKIDRGRSVRVRGTS